MQAAKRTPVDLKEWAVSLLEKNNRKSHLAPQLSPSTQSLLRSGDSPTSGPYSTTSPDYSLPTPTSGDIPIGGGDVRSAVASPQYNEPINSSRSPPIQNGSLGRASGAIYHPGLPPRVSTTNSIPKVTTLNAPEHGATNGPSSANAASFNTTTLAMRPAPPGGPLPPPPVPKKENVDLDGKEKSRRQATFGNGLYGSGYPSAGSGSNSYDY